MDTIKYLNQVINLEKDLERKQEHLMRLEQRMIYVSPSYESTGATPATSNPNKLANQIAEKELMEKNITELQNKIVEKRQRIMRTIDSLHDNDACDVLYLKYIRGYNFSKIAEILERKTKWVYYKHQIAVDLVSEKLKEYRVYKRNTVHVYDMSAREVVCTGTIIEAAEYIGITLGTAYMVLAQGVKKNNHLIVPDPYDYEYVAKLIHKYEK